jgi:hypothetical protein
MIQVVSSTFPRPENPQDRTGAAAAACPCN